jgi:glycosyltransferase involved in cell wall biosynthesis
MDFSVIIATHNNCEILRRCLACWEQLTDGQSVEILVIEDGCQDGTREFLKDCAATPWGQRHLRWFHEEDVHELACDNRGAREAQGKYLLIWHDDMYLQVPWLLEDLRINLEKYPNFGLIALSRGLQLHDVVEPWETWEEMLDRRRNESTIGPTGWNWFCFQEIDGVVRPWVVRRDAWEKVGPLDTHFSPTEWDESDLCFRLRQGRWDTVTYGYERMGAYHHLLSATMARTPSARSQAVAVANGRKFYERWQETIRQSDLRLRRHWQRRWSWGSLAALGPALKKRLGKRTPEA